MRGRRNSLNKHGAWRVNWILNFYIAMAVGVILPVTWAKDIAAPLTPLASDGIHDPANPALKILQLPAESMADFPKDRRGEVDWVQTLRTGVINPRKSLTGKESGGAQIMQTLNLDIIMTNTKQMPHVRFPHLAHTEWLACSNCHPDIFISQKDANPISMEKILKGEYCGRCHDKVSFSLFNCERCHSIPHKDSGPAWWK